jgi:hypothetical protein
MLTNQNRRAIYTVNFVFVIGVTPPFEAPNWTVDLGARPGIEPQIYKLPATASTHLHFLPLYEIILTELLSVFV